MGPGKTSPPNRGEQLEIEIVLPLRIGDGFEGTTRRAPGIVHKNIHVTELAHDARVGGKNGVGVTDVTRVGFNSGAGTGGRGFRGDLDEVCFHSRALTAAEVFADAMALPGGLAAADGDSIRAIAAEAALSYLGFGLPLEIPSWGRMISDAVPGGLYINAPFLMVFPGTLLVVTVLAFNLLGDGLRDALDPRGGTIL